MPVQVRASIWFFVCSFLQKGITAITTPIFTRIMTSAEYGQFNVYLSWQAILSIFLTLNLCYGYYTQGLVKYEDDRNNFISSLQGFTLLLLGLWTLIYLPARALVNHWLSLTTVQILCMIVTIWTTTVYCFWAAEQRVIYSYRRLVIITLLVSVVKPIIEVVFILHSEDKVTARILGILIAELLGYGWMFLSQIRRGGHLYSRTYWRSSVSFGVPMVPHYLSQTVLNSSDRIMIQHMVSDSKAGIYSLAYSVSMIMNLFNTALTQSIGPWVYQKIKEKKVEEIGPALEPTIVFVALVNVLLIALAPEVVRIFAPREYFEAIWTIPPVVMSVYFIYLYSLFSYIEFYYEKSTYIATATLIAAAVNLVLNYIGIQTFGYIVAGYTTLICFAVYAAGHFFVMNSILKQYFDGAMIFEGSRLIVITVLFMAAGFGFCALYNHTILRYILLGAMICALFIKRKWIAELVSDVLSKRNSGKTG